jgi:hypothetical protein
VQVGPPIFAAPKRTFADFGERGSMGRGQPEDRLQMGFRMPFSARSTLGSISA